MQIVQVKLPANSYNIYIGTNLEQEIINFCQQQKYSAQALIITDTNVAPLYGEWLKNILETGGLTPVVVTIPAGESSKSLVMAEKLYTDCIENNLDRKSPIFALGGGVVGDLAGFIAATYMRGVPFVQVPTSLLAQVDSSVGGKVAVNHTLGKNLIGAFYQPQAVFMDLNTLQTLPKREIYTGLGEIIKYGIIYDKEFFGWLENHIQEVLELDTEVAAYMIARSCEIKATVVEQDEKENGLRAILNFGHTAAHAIEKNTGYARYNHGEAVAIGMVCAAHISCSMGLVQEIDVQQVIKLIQAMQLPVAAEGCQDEQLYHDTFHDKKTVGGKVNWILMNGIGQVSGHKDVPQEYIMQALQKCIKS